MAAPDRFLITREQARRMKSLLQWFETSGLAEGGSNVNTRPKSISSFAPGDFQKVKVYQAGGNTGSATQKCAFVYLVKRFDGTVLGQSDVNPIAPSWPRTMVGKYVPHENGQICVACLEPDNRGQQKLRLIAPPEAPAVRKCT